ncbi:response regulator [Hyphobacterium marinum]|uniref:Response regulator n=1 Tax=Hyphobacterium marinum TaxID=3116574 RepID=A0ABU7M204_9PROT|nr:response regulator [Hyphobacterium sp. Y6023]MEE2567300.1 response regulator [Hyphobacterium sp. Y6023]
MPANLQQLRVLVVDDNPHMLKIVRTILNAFGIDNIFEAESVREGLDIARHESIDIAIVDYQMEPDNGLTLIRKLRDEDQTSNPLIPIVMLSAYSERTRVIAARDAGVNEFCCKPITAKDLFAKISAVIDRPRAYVRTKEFFGPDRRRHDPNKYKGPKRRSDDPDQSDAA